MGKFDRETCHNVIDRQKGTGLNRHGPIAGGVTGNTHAQTSARARSEQKFSLKIRPFRELLQVRRASNISHTQSSIRLLLRKIGKFVGVFQ